jgi:hypothetical protein
VPLLGEIKTAEDLQHKVLPEGLDLKYATSEEAAEQSKNLDQNLWVVNVLSAQTLAKIVPPTIELIRHGYHAYVIGTNVKGEEWMRLRVGFFRNRAEAVEEGKKVLSLLHRTRNWVVKVNPKELEEFGGY